MSKLLLGIICFALGQTMIWFQTNGQFKWKWFAENPILLALMFGAIISYTYILGTKYIVEHFEGLLWPGRLIGFGIGAICFAILTYIYMGEGITTKTAISLILATALVAIQIFWK
mgnify:FL=1